jgi:hypothetical protein
VPAARHADGRIELRFGDHAAAGAIRGMKKPANLASLLFLAAAIGVWVCQHALENERLAAGFQRIIMASP